MIKLRISQAALRRGNFETLIFFDNLVAFKRKYIDEEVICIVNPGRAITELKIPTKSTNEEWYDPFAEQAVYAKEGTIFFETIMPDSYILLIKNSNKTDLTYHGKSY